MAGKRQKPRGALADKRPERIGRGDLVLLPDARRKVPATPKGLLPVAGAAWRAFWSTSVADLVSDADLPALRHWAYCISERARLEPMLQQAPLVRGSTGQLRANPLLSTVARLDSEIARTEERFGMTPLARMRLGIATGVAADLLGDLRASLNDIQPAVVGIEDIVDIESELIG